MQKPSDELIFDRTKSDTDRVKALTQKMAQGTAGEAEREEWFDNPKGACNAADLNRIEQWTAYLAEVLQGYGYGVTVHTRTWAMADFPTRSEIDRIRHNVDALQEGFYSLPDWREIVYNNTLDFGQANALEWDLQRLYVWLERMAGAFVYAGEVYAGEWA